MRYQPPEAQANRSGRAPAEGERARGNRLSRPLLPTPPRKAVAALPEKPPERPAADTGSAPQTQPEPRRTLADELGRIGPGLAQGRLWYVRYRFRPKSWPSDSRVAGRSWSTVPSPASSRRISTRSPTIRPVATRECRAGLLK